MRRILATIAAASLCTGIAHAQQKPMIHSHNDYQKPVPFYMAYSFKASAIECDMHYIESADGRGGTFFVGHDARDADSTRTFETMYLEPLATIFRCNGGHAWINDPERKLTLVAEIKTPDPDAYVDALEERLRPYADVFDPSVNPAAVRILITGWKFPSHPEKYPPYYRYDYQYNGVDWSKVTPEEVARIGSISMNFSALSKWKGHGDIDASEKARVQQVIDFAHSLGKPVRFWGAPDCPSCWDLLSFMGADYISTDNIAECTAHFEDKR